MTIRISELYHWGVKKDHKYIARVELSNGKYRYFYDKEEYQNYLKRLNNPNSTYKNILNNNKLIGSTEHKEWNDSITQEQVDEFESKMSSNNELHTKIAISESKTLLSDIVKSTATKTLSKSKRKTLGKVLLSMSTSVNRINEKVKKTYDAKQEKDHKYIAKVKLTNGKYRYFYDQDEYNSYLKRSQYLEDEPEFMKSIPKISDPSSSEEDLAECNPHYTYSLYRGDGYDSVAYTQNCMNCTTTYELRRRGYDVEAGRVRIQNAYNNSVTHWFKDAVVNDIDKSEVKNLETILESNNPPNSRGNLMITRKSGSGHSIVWETDSNGKLKLLDAQLPHKYDIDELIDTIEDANWVRTDNLELKEEVLSTIVPNQHK